MTFLHILDISGSVIVGNFALAMMANEYGAQAWSFNLLTIVIPATFLPVYNDYFAMAGYLHGTVSTNSVPATVEEMHSFFAGGRIAPPEDHFGIKIILCQGPTIWANVDDALSTALTSFVTPSGLFCAYPQLTFNQYTLSMNRHPTYATLYSHHLFGYDLHLSNEDWQIPCGSLCLSVYRCIYESFSVLPFRQDNSTLVYLHLDTWWRIQTNCTNLACPFQGTYI